MIIQFLLTIGLGVFCILAIAMRMNSRLGTVVALGATASGIFFIWKPEATNAIAHIMGVGRGVDLIFYTWIIIAILALLNQQIQIRSLQGMLTRLARSIALADAQAHFPPAGNIPKDKS